jgi:gliding motility-associated-like protein
MSSEHPFDDHLKQAFDGFEPDVHANWAEFESSLEGPSAVVAASTLGRGVSRWAVAAAVVAGGALMWVAKPAVEDLLQDSAEVEASLEPSGEIGLSFDEAWEEFTSVTQEFAEDVLNAEGERALNDLAIPAADAATPSKASESNIDRPSAKPTPTESSTEVASADGSNETQAEEMSRERILAELPFDASVREACEGVEVAFELSGLDRNMSFLWNFGDGHFSSDPAPRHVFNRPGTYDITLSIRPPGDGMIRTRTIQNMITVLPKPDAEFAWAFPAAVSGNKVRVQLQNETLDATASQWVVDGQSTQDNLIQLEVPGVYPVNLVASNKYGCLDDAKHSIQIGDRNGLLAQARFSPNGDGHYDTFLPHSLRDMEDAWEMVIVSREGEEVYRTSEASEPWDGTLPNGDVASDRATFQWTVRTVAKDGLVRLFTDRIRVER